MCFKHAKLKKQGPSSVHVYRGPRHIQILTSMLHRILTQVGIMIVGYDYSKSDYSVSKGPPSSDANVYYALQTLQTSSNPSAETVASTTISRSIGYVLNSLNADRPQFAEIMQKALEVFQGVEDRSVYSTLARALVPAMAMTVGLKLPWLVNVN